MTRRRWVYTQGGEPLPAPVEVGADFQTTRGLQAPVTDLYMDGVRASDGTDIGSRAKRRAYMDAHQLADVSDFKETWQREAKETERRKSGEADIPQRRQAILRAIETTRRRR